MAPPSQPLAPRRAARPSSLGPLVLAAIVTCLAAPCAAFHVVGEGDKISDDQGIIEPLPDEARFGRSVAALGDLDGNGVMDLAVGAPHDRDGGTVVILLLDDATEIVSQHTISAFDVDYTGHFAGSYVAEGRARHEFGFSLAGPGDLNGDGVPDIVIGVPFDDEFDTSVGAVHVCFLGSDGKMLDRSDTALGSVKITRSNGGLQAAIASHDRFGTAVAAVGDLDGDGITDIAVGAPGRHAGAIFLLQLNADGTVKAETELSNEAANMPFRIHYFWNFANTLAGIGDFDGDGTPDLAVGSDGDEDGFSKAGAIYILTLTPNATVKESHKISAEAGGLVGPLAAGDRFGFSIAGAGDLDGNGTPDLYVGASKDDGRSGVDTGALYVLLMEADFTVKEESKVPSLRSGTMDGISAFDSFGSAVAALSMPSNLTDTVKVAVGAAQDAGNGTDRGAVYVLDLAPGFIPSPPSPPPPGPPLWLFVLLALVAAVCCCYCLPILVLRYLRSSRLGWTPVKFPSML
mmetsp:Transcript_6190/g.18467  ORF Transcript_6190/g.18467 Transcript_6190/m.18467 type:complete len:517 (-) Transcript_6190:396-1946(-)